MPIEIRELVIRATVDDSGRPAGEPTPSPTTEQADIVAECVEQVLEALRRQRER